MILHKSIFKKVFNRLVNFLITYRAKGCHTLWDDKIFPGMKKAIIHICQTAQDVVEFRLVLYLHIFCLMWLCRPEWSKHWPPTALSRAREKILIIINQEWRKNQTFTTTQFSTFQKNETRDLFKLWS